MEAILDSIKCTECKHVLDSPILLHCGHSICDYHVKPGAKDFHCSVCDIVHVVPRSGFSRNLALESQLKAKIQNARFCPQYESAVDSIRDIEKSFHDLKLLQTDPYNFVHQTIGDLKMQTDLVREQLKQKVDERANALIDELNKYQDECRRKSNETKEIDAYVNTLSGKLTVWKQSLAQFDSNVSRWGIIQWASEKEMPTLEAKLKEFKKSLLLQKLDDYKQKVNKFNEYLFPFNQQ
jgi:chromosome segregation ATPase